MQSNDFSDGGAKLRRRAGDNRQRNEPQCRASTLCAGPVRGVQRIAFVQQDGNASGTGDDLVQNPDQLSLHFVLLTGVPGDVPARLGQTGDKPGSNGVPDTRQDNGYRCRRPVCRASALPAPDNDHVDLLRDELANQNFQSVHVAIGINESILDVLAFMPAEIAHSLPEGRPQLNSGGF